MAQRIEIEVEIDGEGVVRTTVKGVAGKGCLDLAHALEEALGPVTERTLTAEYYEKEPARITGKTR